MVALAGAVLGAYAALAVFLFTERRRRFYCPRATALFSLLVAVWAALIYDGRPAAAATVCDRPGVRHGRARRPRSKLRRRRGRPRERVLTSCRRLGIPSPRESKSAAGPLTCWTAPSLYLPASASRRARGTRAWAQESKLPCGCVRGGPPREHYPRARAVPRGGASVEDRAATRVAAAASPRRERSLL